MTPAELAALIRARSDGPARMIVALAGPPGAGKSTLSGALVAQVPAARVVPMDGFHYDDAVLTARGLRARKGAPETFDVEGLLVLMSRLRAGGEVAIPIFDRHLELSRAAADVVTDADRVLIVEGNWLLLDEGRWTALAPFFDLTLWIDVPEETLVSRLMTRWAEHGKSPAEARAWIDGNDLPNIRHAISRSRAADVTLRQP
jgi:pantothenate kinase